MFNWLKSKKAKKVETQVKQGESQEMDSVVL